MVALGEDKFAILESLLAEGAEIWANTLVGVIIGRNFPFALVDRIVKKMWESKGLSEVHAFGPEVFFFKFSETSQLSNILEKNWQVLGCPILLKQWEPSFFFFFDKWGAKFDLCFSGT